MCNADRGIGSKLLELFIGKISVSTDWKTVVSTLKHFKSNRALVDGFGAGMKSDHVYTEYPGIN